MKSKIGFAVCVCVVSVMLCSPGGFLGSLCWADPVYSEPVGAIKIQLHDNSLNHLCIPLVADDMRLNETADTIVCVGEMLRQNLEGDTDSDYAAKLKRVYEPYPFYETVYLYYNSSDTEDTLNYKWLNESDAISTMTLSHTEGYYIERPDVADTYIDVVITGWVNMNDTESIQIAAGTNLICWPYPTTIGVSNSAFIQSEDGPSGGDEVKRYKAGVGGFDSAVYSGTDWVPSTLVFDPEDGFFYVADQMGSGLTWIPQRPYDTTP